MAKRFKNFKIGHVERVFTDKEDMVWYAGSADKAERSTSQIILLSPTAGLLPSMKNRRYARPLLRGVSDSITRGDLVLYTTIARKRFYLGPLNTLNSPNYSPDHTHREGRKGTKGTGKDGYSAVFPKTPAEKKIKKKSSILDRFGPDLEEYSELDLLSKFTDMTVEGRHGNSIRLGSRREKPQIMISNKRWSSVESRLDGSNISMLSVGSLMQNLYGYGQVEGHWSTLSCDELDTENPREIHINYGNDPLPAEDGLVEDHFDYNYGNPLITHEDIQVYGKNQSNQMILFSDRIIFDAKQWDLTFSAHRNINLGAGKNFTLTNKGFSVIESNNIYLGKKAKGRKQPMVLGEELRKLLLDIMIVLQDSRALVQGVPIPLVRQDSSPMGGAPGTSIQNIIDKLQPRTYEKDENGKNIETKPKIDGSPILSHYHYIEQNHRS